MLRSFLDHLVVTAPTLAIGTEYVRDALGVTPEQGGEHVRMGTHNCLLKLGDSIYLEVIAVNPDAPPPKQLRWFELDEAESNEVPRLATWVVRTNDIKAALTACATPAPDGAGHVSHLRFCPDLISVKAAWPPLR